MEDFIIKCPYKDCNEDLKIGISLGMKMGILDKGVAKCPYCNRHFTLLYKNDIITLDIKTSENDVKARNLLEDFLSRHNESESLSSLDSSNNSEKEDD